MSTYARRIKRWSLIRIAVRGKDKDDRRVLLKSWLWGFFDSWKSVFSWRDPLLLENAAIRVEGVGDFQLRALTDDLWHVYPGREPEVFALISEALRPGDIFVDAGANIGFYSVLASRKVGASGKVLAIEMMPGTSRVLRQHLKMNSCENVEVIEAALSDVAGEFVDAYVTPEQCGQASLARNSDQSDKVRVRTTTLDQVAGQIGKVKLLKMDLEGVELQALRGARSLLDRVESICFEDRNGDSPVRPFLEELGFQLSPLGGADVLAVRGQQSERR